MENNKHDGNTPPTEAEPKRIVPDTGDGIGSNDGDGSGGDGGDIEISPVGRDAGDGNDSTDAPHKKAKETVETDSGF